MSAAPPPEGAHRRSPQGEGHPVSAQHPDDEDLTGLFAAFGGDVSQYQEFNNAAGTADPRPNWTLLKSLGADPHEAVTAQALTASGSAPTPVHGAAAVAPSAPAPAPATATAAASATALTRMPDLAQVFEADPTFRTEPVFQPTPTRAAAPAPSPTAPPAAPLVFDAAVLRPSAAQLPAASPPAAQRPPSSSGTPLAALFERLAQAPAPETFGARSLMAHWRRPS